MDNNQNNQIDVKYSNIAKKLANISLVLLVAPSIISCLISTLFSFISTALFEKLLLYFDASVLSTALGFLSVFSDFLRILAFLTGFVLSIIAIKLNPKLKIARTCCIVYSIFIILFIILSLIFIYTCQTVCNGATCDGTTWEW